ncbi:MAG: hypothetical protein ACI8ZB_004228 [Desulforhopalus sp.]|jgi:hypothetical protein
MNPTKGKCWHGQTARRFSVKGKKKIEQIQTKEQAQ